ncbi:MAG: hypothetical protein ACFFD4_30585, partial [Candidatus Odinarchaeota archaeon]
MKMQLELELMDKYGKMLTVLFTAGLFLTITGFGIHCCSPTDITSTRVFIELGEAYIEHFELVSPLIETSFQMKLRLNIFQAQAEDFTVVLLNETEFLKFTNNIPLDDLAPIIDTVGVSDKQNTSLKYEQSLQFMTNEDVNFYLVIINGKTSTVITWFYMGILPPTYYTGLVLSIIGTVLIIISLLFNISISYTA